MNTGKEEGVNDEVWCALDPGAWQMNGIWMRNIPHMLGY